MNVKTHEVIRHEITPDKVESAVFSAIQIDHNGAFLKLRGDQVCVKKIDRSEQAHELGAALIEASKLMVEQEKAAALRGKQAVQEVSALASQ